KRALLAQLSSQWVPTPPPEGAAVESWLGSTSPAGVRCVWQRHDLTSIKHRLKALEAKVAQDGILLTEAQIAALEKAKADKEAHGEFDSECPGYCGRAGHFLCRHAQGCRAGLSTDLHRHLRQGGVRQTLRSQDPDHGGRNPQ